MYEVKRIVFYVLSTVSINLFRGTMQREMGQPNSTLLQEAEMKIKAAIEKEKEAENCLKMV